VESNNIKVKKKKKKLTWQLFDNIKYHIIMMCIIHSSTWKQHTGT